MAWLSLITDGQILPWVQSCIVDVQHFREQSNNPYPKSRSKLLLYGIILQNIPQIIFIGSLKTVSFQALSTIAIINLFMSVLDLLHKVADVWELQYVLVVHPSYSRQNVLSQT